MERAFSLLLPQNVLVKDFSAGEVFGSSISARVSYSHKHLLNEAFSGLSEPLFAA